MIATALVVTPLATLAPVNGTAVVEASETLPTGTFEAIQDLKSYYDGLDAEAKKVIDDHRLLLDELTTEDWSDILGDLEDVINGKLSGDHTATGMLTDLAEVFLQGTFNDVLAKVIAFHKEYQDDFNNAFGISFVDFLGFYANLVENVKKEYNKSTIDAAIGNSLTNFMVAEARKVSKYTDLSAAVKGAIGEEYTVASLVKMKFDLMTVLSDKDLDAYAPGTLKNTLIAAVKNNLDPAPSTGPIGPGAPGPVGPVVPPTPGVTIVDASDIERQIKDLDKVEVVKVTIEAAPGQPAQAKIPSAAIAVIAAKNPKAVVEVASTEGTLRLPVAEVSNARLAAALGVPAGTAVEITVSVNKVQDTAGVVAKNNLKSVSNVVEFKIHASAGDKTVEINRFSQYLEREIVAEANFNAAKSSVVRLNDDGTFTAVPSVFNGKSAVFKSFSNSKYTVVENEVTFKDVATGKPGAWAKATIEKLGSKYIVQGKANGNFDPVATTTRAEFATLLTRSLGLSTTATYNGQFSDVKGTEWFTKDLVAAVEAGIIKGHANGTFGYNDPVTREEAAVMITRALNLVNFDNALLDSTVDVTKFQDAGKVAPWAKSSVTTLVQLGITEGRPNGFAPKAGTQRAEMAALLERFLVKVNFMN